MVGYWAYVTENISHMYNVYIAKCIVQQYTFTTNMFVKHVS